MKQLENKVKKSTVCTPRAVSLSAFQLLAQPFAWRSSPRDKTRHEGHVFATGDFTKTVVQEREAVDFIDVVHFPRLLAGVC